MKDFVLVAHTLEEKPMKMKIGPRLEPCEVNMKKEQLLIGPKRVQKKWRVRFSVGFYFALLMTLIAPISPVHAPTFDATKAQAVEIDLKSYTRNLAEFQYDWGKQQFICLGKMWGRESAWDYTAESPTHDYGIPQRHMSHNTPQEIEDFLQNPFVQISWGLNYIEKRYGSPCQAWNFWQERNWY